MKHVSLKNHQAQDKKQLGRLVVGALRSMQKRPELTKKFFENYLTMDLRIAIDDFGSGFAGLKLLHMSQPDIVKIDRHFVTGSDAEPRKAAFLGKIVGMAHLMGVSVVAEGIETEAELAVCVEAGCDMIQGYLLARPACGRDAFVQSFPALSGEASGARRGRHRGLGIAASSPKFVPPMHRSDDLLDVLGRFRKEPELDIIPVVDDSDEPIGVYLERDFRQYVYSPFGIALLEHLKSGKGAASFLRKAPTACLGVDLAGILEVFGGLPASGGVLLTRESKYAGLIPAVELLSLVAERDVAEARDQNPLTRLPGNLRVAELIAQRAAELERSRAFIYFDFDDFKPFNDRYGFRLGDRVIQLFADILRSVFGQPDCFVGHLGGDDFFASSYATSIDEALGLAGEASARFGREASSFYSVEDRERGWILGRDRAGEERRMPTMGLSFAIVLAAPGAQPDAESLSDIFAVLKKRAKTSSSHAAYRVLGAQGEEGPTLSPESLGPAGRELGAQGGGLVRYLPYALYKRGREAEDPPHLGEREVASALHLG